MPICLASAHGLQMTTNVINIARCSKHPHHRITLSQGVQSLAPSGTPGIPNVERRVTRGRRMLSNTAAAAALEKLSAKAKVLTLLHKTTRFLPRALARAQPTHLDHWDRTLSDVWGDLSTGGMQKTAQVAVYGVDEWSGARTLITALLQDPLASTASYNAAIGDRWEVTHPGRDVLLIEEGELSTSEPDTLRIPSSWFQRFSHPTQILELPSPSLRADTFTATPPLYHILLRADIPILLFNPLTTPVSSLLKYTQLLRNPNAIILISVVPTSQDLASRIHDLLSQSTSSTGAKIMFVDPDLALRALSALTSDPTNARNVEKYQYEYTLSNISRVNAAIGEALSKFSGRLGMLQVETALTSVRLALEACKDLIHAEERDLDGVYGRVSELRRIAEEARTKARWEVLGPGVGKIEESEVAVAIKAAEKEMRVVMDDLTWWRMLGRVDEIGVIVGNAVRRVWCKDLEAKLIFKTGRLSALQTSLTSAASLLPTQLPSPLLQNTLSQLSSSPSYPLHTSTLIAPLQTRQEQLISFPTTRLHIAAQNAVLRMLGGTVGGAGAAAYIFFEGAAGIGLSGGGSAAGAMMLCTLLGVRWAVGKWERAKRRWWADWKRVGEGLGRDLKDTLDRTLGTQVLVVTEHAAEGLEVLARKRREELEGVKEELETLETELAETSMAINHCEP